MTRFIQYYANGRFLNGIEIGTYAGYNAKNMFLNLPIRKLYCIDPYIESEPWDEPLHIKGIEGVEEYAHEYLKDFEQRIIWLKHKSSDAVRFIADNIIDFVYIDGDHSYDVVLSDIENYYPIVRKLGVIGGHDFNGEHNEVCHAVIDFIYHRHKNLNLKLHSSSSDWWIIKELTEVKP